MRYYRFGIFEQTSGPDELRFFDPAGQLSASRELLADDVDRFIDEVERDYWIVSPDLQGLGQRLYRWLDGPASRWMSEARQPETGIQIDVAGRLRALPWELMFQGGVFLCTDPNAPCFPVRRVGTAKEEREVANRPLRILLMACSPQGVIPALDFEDEERRILEQTRHLGR